MRKIYHDKDEREADFWELEEKNYKDTKEKKQWEEEDVEYIEKKDVYGHDDTPVNNSLQLYLKDINRIPLLSAEEERILGERIKNGDEAALEKFVNANYRLVVRIAKKYRANGLTLYDLIQEGNIFLIEAAKKYDYTRGTRFSSYAVPYISGKIKDIIAKASGIERYWDVWNLRKARIRFEEMYGRRPSVEELAEELNVSITVVNNILDAEKEDTKFVSMEEKVGGEDGNTERGDLLSEILPESKKMLEEREVMEEWNNKLMALEDNEQNGKIKAVWEYLKVDQFGDESDEKVENLKDQIKQKLDMSDEELNECKERLVMLLGIKQSGLPINKESRTYKLLMSEKERLGANPSDETVGLDAFPISYKWIFDGMENEDDTEIEEFLSGQTEKDFLEAVSQIRSTPPYKCIMRYLLDYYNIIISAENEKRLWEFLAERPKISIQESKQNKWKPVRESLLKKLEILNCDEVVFSKEECRMLVAMLMEYMKDDYLDAGIKKSNWTDYFYRLFFDLEQDKPGSEESSTECLNKMALVTTMDLEVYYNFRKKLLKRREKDYLDKEFIFMYLILKYAKKCDVWDYVEAYDVLSELYKDISVTEEDIKANEQSNINSSLMIGERLLRDISPNDKLAEKYKDTLFFEKVPELMTLFKHIEVLKQKGQTRSDKKTFLKEWDELENKMGISNRTKVFEFLYGGKNHNEAFCKLGKEYIDFFLDSEEFEHTYIEDNSFSQFAKKGDRNKRNVILTVIFLGVTYDLKKAGCVDYEERVNHFEERVLKAFAPCGFRILHSGSAYDTYLKLLLACPDPLEIFRYVWSKKLQK